ncbi:MAG: hypothetical protein WCP07_11275 [bacterium]
MIGYPYVALQGGVTAEALPVGVQIVARPWREDVAVAITRHMETDSRGWRPHQL